MSVRPLCEPGELDIRRPLPGRSATPQRVTAVAAEDGLEYVAVATAAPWFPGLGELLVLRPGSGLPPVRLPVARGPRAAVVHDLLLSRGGAALTVSLGGSEEHHIGQVVHFSSVSATELWRRSVGRSVYGAWGDTGGVRLAVSGDGSVAAACEQGSRTVVAWSSGDGRRLLGGSENRGRTARIGGSEAVAADRTGSRLAFRLCRPYERAPEGAVAVVDLPSGRLAVHPTGLGWCSGLAFSPDGRELAVLGTAGDTAVSVLLDLTAPPGAERRTAELAELPGEARQQTLRPVWGARGPRAALRTGRTVTVWDLAAAAPLRSVAGLGRSTAWALTPDGRTFVVAAPEAVHAYHLG